MAPKQLDIVLDLSAQRESEFFDEHLRDRLRAVGQVRRVERSEDRCVADVVITGWESQRLPDRRTEGGTLGLVAHTGGTVRFLVPKSLIEDGVQVTQTAAAMAPSVAELCLMQTISLLRGFHLVTTHMTDSRDWAAAIAVPTGDSVVGTRIGVVGASRVGRIYIAYLRALGAEVLVHDPYLSAADAEALGVCAAPLDDLFATCRLVALHAPVTDETRGMVDARRLALIPDGGALINTARAALVDSAALVNELRSGRISAALDVFDEEPLPLDDPLWGLSNVLLTPHRGAITRQAQLAMGAMVVDEIERFARGDQLVSVVTADRYDTMA
ncbi:hydroxyacid dehydrogenase [Microbacterium sp. NPDC076911]|uniref:hydroxyacid dehydrogenase n=1 Tax=Microbacterium sp. NPDC076911 TaxID=3154958 RepID=UPI003447595B